MEARDYFKNKRVVEINGAYKCQENDVKNLFTNVTEKEQVQRIFENVLTRIFEEQINYGRLQISVAVYLTVKNHYNKMNIDVEEELLKSIEKIDKLTEYFDTNKTTLHIYKFKESLQETEQLMHQQKRIIRSISTPNFTKYLLSGYLYGIFISSIALILF